MIHNITGTAQIIKEKAVPKWLLNPGTGSQSDSNWLIWLVYQGTPVSTFHWPHQRKWTQWSTTLGCPREIPVIYFCYAVSHSITFVQFSALALVSYMTLCKSSGLDRAPSLIWALWAVSQISLESQTRPLPSIHSTELAKLKCFCNTKIYVIGPGEIFLRKIFCPRYGTEIVYSLILCCLHGLCMWIVLYVPHGYWICGGCCVYFVSPCRLVHCQAVPVSQEMKHLAPFSGMKHCYQYDHSPTKQNKIVAYSNIPLC